MAGEGLGSNCLVTGNSTLFSLCVFPVCRQQLLFGFETESVKDNDEGLLSV